MRFEIPKCPKCGEQPRGTLETVTGLAQLMPVEGAGDEFEYEGYTEVYWDEQKSVLDKDGRATLICSQGHDWQSGVNWEDEPPTPQEPEHDGVNCGCKSFDDCPGR